MGSACASRAEQRRRTQDRIVVAARRLFAEHGYDRTTIRAIAAEAKTDPGLVMRYFESKEKLFARVAVVGTIRNLLSALAGLTTANNDIQPARLSGSRRPRPPRRRPPPGPSQARSETRPGQDLVDSVASSGSVDTR